ncbi:Fic family protein [Treponema sp.]|uniref:Fic family protein n=1 Tax=Treponema sp. TaxID=166 RepID=UPI003F0CD1F4
MENAISKDINSNRSGTFVQNLSGELTYRSFNPSPLPPQPTLEIDANMLSLLIEANRKVAYLDAISEKIPNQNLFLSMYVRKEALVSSQIEGTQCTLDDVLDPNADENANIDVGEVINYIRASNFAISRLNELPLCMRLLKETHAELIKDVRGSDKTPGEFRTTQNWIGGQGSTLKNARYIPPCVDDMKKSLDDLEKYMNSNDSLDPLIQAALIHYQFETIHPFLDGNGRVGRLLITLFLMQKKIISKPVLYISCFLKMNRIEYYDRLSEVRQKGNYEQWVRFFLQIILETANDAIESINALEELHKKNIALLEKVPARTRDNALKLFEYIEKKAIIDTSKTALELGLSYNTTAKNIELLCGLKILYPSAKNGKASLYSYTDYLEILRKGTEIEEK